jgi:hypothetical protein
MDDLIQIINIKASQCLNQADGHTLENALSVCYFVAI